MPTFKIYNWWSLFGAILVVLVIYNLWTKGNTTVTLFNGVKDLALGTINALKVAPDAKG